MERWKRGIASPHSAHANITTHSNDLRNRVRGLEKAGGSWAFQDLMQADALNRTPKDFASNVCEAQTTSQGNDVIPMLIYILRRERERGSIESVNHKLGSLVSDDRPTIYFWLKSLTVNHTQMLVGEIWKCVLFQLRLRTYNSMTCWCCC